MGFAFAFFTSKIKINLVGIGGLDPEAIKKIALVLVNLLSGFGFLSFLKLGKPIFELWRSIRNNMFIAFSSNSFDKLRLPTTADIILVPIPFKGSIVTHRFTFCVFWHFKAIVGKVEGADNQRFFRLIFTLALLVGKLIAFLADYMGRFDPSLLLGVSLYIVGVVDMRSHELCEVNFKFAQALQCSAYLALIFFLVLLHLLIQVEEVLLKLLKFLLISAVLQCSKNILFFLLLFLVAKHRELPEK
ncbi:hypothetical protein AM586_10315 [Massilia sp. WG5]|nr:hypothetical protein AM586_10315 [Massilia sp. WG5]